MIDFKKMLLQKNKHIMIYSRLPQNERAKDGVAVSLNDKQRAGTLIFLNQ